MSKMLYIRYSGAEPASDPVTTDWRGQAAERLLDFGMP
jgi:hypothetical protein